MHETIVGSILDVCAKDPARAFCIHYIGGKSTTITYEELLNRSCQASARLREWGCRRGDVVLIFVRHQPELYFAFLGCMLSGVIPSFMPYPNAKQDVGLFWKNHRALLDRLQPKLLIVSQSLTAEFTANLPEHAPLVRDAGDLSGTPLEPEIGSADDIAFLQHSSGTTGLKKGVMLSHRQVMGQLTAYRDTLGFSERDIIASWLPLYHDMGLIACFILPMVTGATLVALDPHEWVGRPGSLLTAIERHGATFCWLPNFAFHHLALTARAGTKYDLSTIRAFVNCSEPCKPESFETFLKHFGDCGISASKLQVCYAMAETVFAVTQTPLGTLPRTLQVDRGLLEEQHRIVPGDGPLLISCGRPVPGIALNILADDRTELPERRIGEIAVKSSFTFSGYYRQPEITARKMRGGWYYTGDLGFLDDGELFVTGRKDDLLIAYGRNYYAHEIEQIATTVDGVVPGRSVAFAVANETIGSSQIVLVAETDGTIDPESLTEALLSAIHAGCGLVLHTIELQPKGWLIKTSSGKIHRETNRARFLEART